MSKRLFSVFFLLAFSATGILAQSALEQAAKDARERFSDVKNRSIELERMKREAGKRSAGEASTASAFPYIKEDFEEIQKLNSRVYELAAAKSPLDYAVILKFASEINQRAIRLESNLFASESAKRKAEKTKLPIADKTPDMAELLETLDKSINNFVHSPLFQNTNLVNSQDSLNAQNDLRTVVEVSFLVKEEAKKLKKQKPAK